MLSPCQFTGTNERQSPTRLHLQSSLPSPPLVPGLLFTHNTLLPGNECNVYTIVCWQREKRSSSPRYSPSDRLLPPDLPVRPAPVVPILQNWKQPQLTCLKKSHKRLLPALPACMRSSSLSHRPSHPAPHHLSLTRKPTHDTCVSLSVSPCPSHFRTIVCAATLTTASLLQVHWSCRPSSKRRPSPTQVRSPSPSPSIPWSMGAGNETKYPARKVRANDCDLFHPKARRIQ